MEKREIFRKFLALGVAVIVAAAVTGCGGIKQKVKEEPEPIVKEEPKPEPVAPAPLEFGKAYFSYNQAGLSSAAKGELKKAADLLLANPDAKINIDGHCDERGTDEYNMDLGWKRAYAARDYLKKMGIDEGRLFPASYGRSRPAVTGTDDSAWSKNRRVEISVRK